MGFATHGVMGVLCLAVSSFIPLGATVTTPSTRSSSKPPAIVIGFLGGMVRHDNRVHGGVQIAERLRKEYPDGVFIQVFENRRGDDAHRAILQLLDTDHDGKLSTDEKQNARIVIYGHSWGGSETVTLARQLEHDGIPVRLTIQIDSVAKIGESDSVIPSNVKEAVNYYQPSGIIHGCPQIRAADPARTKIIGNFRLDYSSNPVQCEGYPWFATAFMYSHIEIECDPSVLSRVDALIRSQLPPPGGDSNPTPSAAINPLP